MLCMLPSVYTLHVYVNRHHHHLNYHRNIYPYLSRNVRQMKLYSSSMIAIDERYKKVIFSKNASLQLPIASLSKIMSAIVFLDSHPDLSKYVVINRSDARLHASSRLHQKIAFRRKDLLLLALMSSENRAIHALARTTFAGGIDEFVKKMNAKAMKLGMYHTKFVEPTGLSVNNVSTVNDLAKLV